MSYSHSVHTSDSETAPLLVMNLVLVSCGSPQHDGMPGSKGGLNRPSIVEHCLGGQQRCL